LDPDGKDAIAVNFLKEVPVGGHVGIIVVHADGSATYARFGPEHAASPADKGQVTVRALNSVKFGSNGLPTDASYKELSEEVAKIEEQPPGIGGAVASFTLVIWARAVGIRRKARQVAVSERLKENANMRHTSTFGFALRTTRTVGVNVR
jgi:hypothetical protein